MMMPEIIFKLNNEAAFCIQNKEYNRSIELLQKAATQIRETMTASSTTAPQQQQQQQGDNCCYSSADSSITTNQQQQQQQQQQQDETNEHQEPQCFLLTNNHDKNNRSNFCCFLTTSAGSSESSLSDLDSCCFLKSKRSSSSTLEGQEDSSSSSSSYHTMFASPIIFNRAVSLFEPLAFERVSYVLVYNLALAHHCMAIQVENDFVSDTSSTTTTSATSTCSSSFSSPQPSVQTMQAQHHHAVVAMLQQKALSLYEKSYCLFLVQEEEEESADNDWDISVLHSLSILCNLGHLHHMMGSNDKAEVCFQNLLSMICYIVDSTSIQGQQGRGRGNSRVVVSTTFCNHDNTIIPETLLDGFLWNVMHLFFSNKNKGGTVTTAAAA